MTDDRLDEYLRGLDREEAADWLPASSGYAPGFDEWNAARIAAGLTGGTFTEYLQSINHGDQDVQQGS